MSQLRAHRRLAPICLLAAAFCLRPTLSPAARPASPEILWDEFGIPHIYAPDLLSVVRGLGYAEMENHAETLLMNVASARGRSAEYFGAGSGNANVTSDIAVRTEGIPYRAQAWLDHGGEEQRAIIGAFADGVNEYAAKHGDTIDAAFKRVLPFVPTDVTAGEQNTVNFTFIPEQDNIPALLAAWQKGGLAAARALARSFTPGGSNGWALGPKKSASGNPILMGNPHLPWGNNAPIPGLGLYQWMETNLVIGDPQNPSLNASGVVFMGSPFIGIGYSDDVGWTHTNNTIQNCNLYQLTLNPDGTYHYGGGTRPLQHHADVIKIRQADGSLASQTIDIFDSVQGPVIARRGRTALALRVAGLDAPSLVSQYWGMIRAKNLDAFIAANSALQMPFFNVVYADRGGHILYLFGGRQPVRPAGVWGDYDGILDGSDPSLVWTRTLSWNDLPRAIDPPGGFVANSNNPPWTSTFPQMASNDPANFPAYLAPQFMDFRPQNAASFLLSHQTLSADEVLHGKESVHMLLADRILPDLLMAAQASGNATAIQAANVLAAWDRNADAESKGAVLFEAFWQAVASDPAIEKDRTDDFYSPHPKFRIGWSVDDPLNTPLGLADPAAAVPDLVAAAQQVQAAFGALDVAWGAVHKTVLVSHDPTYQRATPVADQPGVGPDDEYGPVRVVNPFPAPDGTHDLWSYGGDGYVQLVEFTPSGAQARALLTAGNASRPGSPHITDQLKYYDAKTLRAAYRIRADVEKHAVKREPY
jgi:acyl-homoserine-lactone acylase